MWKKLMKYWELKHYLSLIAYLGQCAKFYSIIIAYRNVSLFRSQNIAERKRYVKLVDSVKESGGDVKIFSSMHVTGERKLILCSIIFL